MLPILSMIFSKTSTEPDVRSQIQSRLNSQEWRLNNLYWITDKRGQKIRFQLNWAQQFLLKYMWFLNLVLKARQLGCTTFICILFLDTALFTSNTKCGIIAHTLDDVGKIFRDKIQFVYNNLPESLRTAITTQFETARELVFNNGSSISVGLSFRGGTYQYLLVSEYGKICAKYPEKAREIRTGAMEAVAQGCYVFIESTAEGSDGDFYERCQESLSLSLARKTLTKMDYRFFFFPWWQEPTYTMDSGGVVIPDEDLTYFAKLEQKIGRQLTIGQKCWYVKKKSTLKELMRREYPSTPQEAFEVAIEGSYYANEFLRIDEEGRICELPFQSSIPCRTGWDLGFDDFNAIWVYQKIGEWFHFLKYYENCHEGLGHYAHWCRDWKDEKRGSYDRHWLPHDVNVTDISRNDKKTRKQVLEDDGLDNIRVVEKKSIQFGIEESRQLLARSKFDAVGCDVGIKRLRNFRKDYNIKTEKWTDSPRRDNNKHGADALRYVAVGEELSIVVTGKKVFQSEQAVSEFTQEEIKQASSPESGNYAKAVQERQSKMVAQAPVEEYWNN